MIFLKRINTIVEKYVEVLLVLVDKSFRYIAIITQTNNRIFILSPFMLIQHMLQFKQQFEERSKWQLPTLPCLKEIVTTKECSITDAKFLTIESDVYLGIGLYDGVIEIYKADKWKLVKRFKTVDYLISFIITEQKLIYTLDYGKDMRCFSMETGKMKGMKLDIELVQGIHNSSKDILVETAAGFLINEKEEILLKHQINQQRMLEDNTQTNYEQFKQYYSLDFSGEYVIARSEASIYKLSQMKEYHFDRQFQLLEISPFSYTEGRYGMMCYGNTVCLYNIQSQEEYLRVQNLKKEIKRVVWVGPFQVLMVDCADKLHYLEMFHEKLKLTPLTEQG